MGAYILSHKLLDAWREIMIASQDPGSINKTYPVIHACVIMDDGGRRRVIGCHIDGTDVVLDLESNNG
jgi:hypothetical protein